MSPAAALHPTAITQLAQAVCAVRVMPAMPMPSGLAERAAAHVLDWLGCAAQGASSPTGQAMARWLLLQAAGPQPTLAGRFADPAAAAAYHGALGGALEMDDVHRSAILHPGPVVVPAALAAASAASVDTPGALFLSAVVAGYEATIRVGRALGPGHYRLWHPTATAGVFGAAAAAATVLGLDAATTAQALALAGTRSGGLWQVRHETQAGKAWHTAGAAREGLAAAQLASVGLTGPLGVLCGPSGWFAATAPDARVDCIGEARATPWIDDVSFKPWPACRHAHPALDALQGAVEQTEPAATAATAAQGADPAQRAASIEQIHVHTYNDALRFCDRLHPSDAVQARFSIQHVLAAWLVWGTPQLAHSEPPALADAQVRALRERVHLHADAAIEARYPAHYGARVEVHWRDGRRSQHALTDTWGDPARPMSQRALHDKARMLMAAAGWTVARAEAAVAACVALPQAPDLRALHAVLHPGLHPARQP